MGKEDAVYTYIHIYTRNGIRLSHRKKKERNKAICNSLALEMTMPSEVRKKQKGKYHDITYTWDGKKGIDELICETDSQT